MPKPGWPLLGVDPVEISCSQPKNEIFARHDATIRLVNMAAWSEAPDRQIRELSRACAPGRFSQCDAGEVRVAGNMRAWLAGGSLIALLAATACSGTPNDRQLMTESTMPRAEAVKWTGLEDTTGLAIDLVHEEGFQDTLVEVILRGSAADIDRAMTSAKFATELSPGLTVQAPPEGFDPNQLADVRSAQQAWTNHLGQHIYRNAIRGRLGNGDDMLFFTAFST